MIHRSPLGGVRVHLSGSVPDHASPEQAAAITAFVELLAAAIFRNGGSIIHGSHPSFLAPLQAAAKAIAEIGGRQDALTLVWSQHAATGVSNLTQIAALRTFAAVQIIPSAPGAPQTSLVPMREWMADRSDVVIAVGGRHWEISTGAAGVPEELDESLLRGRPGFIVAGFGGAIAGYVCQNEYVFRRLRNGLSEQQNRSLAASTDAQAIVSAIVEQLVRLDLPGVFRTS